MVKNDDSVPGNDLQASERFVNEQQIARAVCNSGVARVDSVPQNGYENVRQSAVAGLRRASNRSRRYRQTRCRTSRAAAAPTRQTDVPVINRKSHAATEKRR